MKMKELRELIEENLSLYEKLNVPFGLKNKMERLKQLDNEMNPDLVAWVNHKFMLEERYKKEGIQ